MPGLGFCCCCNDIYAGSRKHRIAGSPPNTVLTPSDPLFYLSSVPFDFDPVHKLLFTSQLTGTDPNYTSTFKRYSDDLATLDVLFSSTSFAAMFCACDPDNQHVYYTAAPLPWVASGTSRSIRRVNYDGTGDTSITTFTIASFIPHSAGGTEGFVDIVNARGEGKLLIGYQDRSAIGNPPSSQGYVIETVNYDGSGRTTIYSTALGFVLSPTAHMLEWDNTNKKVLWIERRVNAIPFFSTIKRMNLDGTGVETLLTGPNVGAGKSNLSSIQWSNKRAKIFFEQFDPTVSQNSDHEGGLFSMNADGSGQVLVSEREAMDQWVFGSRIRLGCGFETTGASSLG